MRRIARRQVAASARRGPWVSPIRTKTWGLSTITSGDGKSVGQLNAPDSVQEKEEGPCSLLVSLWLSSRRVSAPEKEANAEPQDK
jgi:hypothetical protein